MNLEYTGVDLTPGKEGGTWLGMNRWGKIGVLLNLDRTDHGFEENKSGRGGFFSPSNVGSKTLIFKL